ncbi:hypothetical protein [Micromonospora sp. DT229]|uniref:hypothetical protein n=1 Tax=Micromonospora sp. DT229 TaxID=3393430 RepID=UPI003CF55336
MDWPRVLLAFVSPFGIWLLSLALLAGQLLFLLFVETRLASGIIDRKLSDYLLAIFGIGALIQYDGSIALPLVTSIYPEHLREEVRESAIALLGGLSLFSMATAFHYSISHVTKFRGRSLLVFPADIYKKDPVGVRKLWIKIFNLIGLTSVTIIAMAHVSIYFVLCLAGEAEAEITLSFMLGLLGVAFITEPARNLILRYPSSLVAISKINQVIAQNAKPSEARRALSKRKSDPIGWARAELLLVAHILDRMARREDSLAGPGNSHPVAAIYRAVADHIRLYCSSARSLEAQVPATTISTLKATAGFMISGDNMWRKQLVKRLNIFRADGSPRPLATGPAAGGAARRVRAVARYADLSLTWLQSRWQALVVVLAVIAIIFGQLSFESLLDMAP